jgi:hypothetical protein
MQQVWYIYIMHAQFTEILVNFPKNSCNFVWNLEHMLKAAKVFVKWAARNILVTDSPVKENDFAQNILKYVAAIVLT